MVTKTKMGTKVTANAKQLAADYKESSQQIWQAGLGAFAKAQAEGTKVFDALVKEGKRLQEKTQGTAQEQFADVTAKASALKAEFLSKATGQIGKLEGIFEERVAKALKQMGIPTKHDIAELHKKIDALKAAKPAAKPVVKAAAKPAAKPVAKKAAAKKVAAKTTKK
jgi:poly(hydroxyalkanoate) granule-associated protein